MRNVKYMYIMLLYM